MAIEVVRKSDGKLVAHQCPSCGILYSILADTPEASKASIESADACCPPRKCTQCNARPVVRGQTVCEVCGAANLTKVEEQRFAAASKTTEAEWTKPVYWPTAPFDGDHGARYWSSIQALRSDVAKRNQQRVTEGKPAVSIPAYVYATKPIPFRIDGRAAVLAALAEHSDAVEITGDQVAVLQKFLDEWADKQVVQSYEEDLTKAVVLG